VVALPLKIVQGDRYFACINLDSGETLWRTTLRGDRPRYTSPVATGSHVLYTFGQVLCVAAESNEYSPAYDARIDEEGLLASEDHFRKLLDIDNLSAEEAEKVWQQKIAKRGPRSCVSPAFVAGRLYLRLNNGIACYDLRAGIKTSSNR